MIKFCFDGSTLRKLSKESIILLSKPFWIFSLISAILSLYFLLVGYLYDSEALMFGYSFLIISIILLLDIFVLAMQIKKGNDLRFKTQNIDGFLNYSVSNKQDGFELKNLNSNSAVKFSKSEILKIKTTKSFIFIKLASKKNLPLFKTKETLALFNDFIIKKKSK